MTRINFTLGRCDGLCTADGSNNGHFGNFLGIDNCKDDGKCDIYINSFNTRHICLATSSITDCLNFKDPQRRVLHFTNGQELDITNSLQTSNFNGLNKITDGRAITESNIIKMLKNFSRPCGVSQSEKFMASSNRGCLPYSQNIESKSKFIFGSNQKCNDKKTTNGVDSACKDSHCSIFFKQQNGTNKDPCTAYGVDVPLTDDWIIDLNFYFCPPYTTQRFFLNGNNLMDKKFICDSSYKKLCNFFGFETDDSCKIYWGGNGNILNDADQEDLFKRIDSDLCNGHEWNPFFLSKNYKKSDFCSSSNLSNSNFLYCNGKNKDKKFYCENKNAQVRNDGIDRAFILPFVDNN